MRTETLFDGANAGNRDHVIITDVRYRMALPVIRSLGRAGKSIACAELQTTPRGKALGFASRYAKGKFLLPDPALGEEQFIDALAEAAGNSNPVILPVGIDSLLAMSRNREKLDAFARTALPPAESLRIANDKMELMRHAGKIGIPCPFTTTLSPDGSILSLANKLSYPVVVKYREGELLRLSAKERYCVARTPAEFTPNFTKMHEKQPYPLVQEYVEGGGFGVSAVFDKKSNPMAVFCHRRLREYPVSGGPSCLCESAWNKELAGYAVKLLQSLNWVGVAMVEFKGSDETGWKLMEINPRFWGTTALAPLSGCDIPLALFRAADGEYADPDMPLEPAYEPGTKMRFLLQDALSLSGYMRRYDNKKAKRAYAVKHIASLLNPTIRGGVFSISDPLPALCYLWSALRKIIRNTN